MFKSIFFSKNLLGLVAIAGVMGAIGVGAFYFTRDDATDETVQSDTLPTDDFKADPPELPAENEEERLLSKVVTLLPKDAIPAILDPQFVSVQDAEGQMTETENVIGISIDGDARAYPIKMLSRHEIVNDVVGGESIAVTW